MTQSQPPVTRTTHTLPFDRLSPRDFERLCLWLVEREGYERAEHLGAAGSEQGRDIVAWREGALWAFQCKRVQNFGPKDALAEVEKVLALLEAERPVGLVFLVICDVSANTRQQVRERCVGEMECAFWAGTELDEKVKRHTDIVEEFFQATTPLVHITSRQPETLSISDTLNVTFQLTAHDERLEVRTAAPGGEGKAETVVPPQALLKQLAEHAPTNIPSSVLESVGKTLYKCLMVGDVAKLASDVLQDGMRLQRPVQFELRFDADQISLAQYPWEMIADDLGRFLVREGLVDVTRYITYPQPPSTFDVAFHDMPLLRVVSQPSKLPPITIIDLVVERVETLHHATFEQFLRKLLIERMAFWGLQFDGHGHSTLRCRGCDAANALDAENCNNCGASLSDAKQVGVLAFERNGEVDWIPTGEFGSILYNARVQLALLLACETARVGDRLVFRGLGPGLILAGVPAVIGMQYPVTDDFASSFSNSFYSALLDQHDLLDALRTARGMTMRGAWYSPVLYLRHRKTASADEPVKSVYRTRNIDTAVPAEVQAGVSFLVRLWIRRPETKPLTQEQLREELSVPESVPISTHTDAADVKFEPVERRKLRRGEVEVRLSSIDCSVNPESIKLFVDEHLDAPPAIFTVRARGIGYAPLVFSVWQDGGQIASITHHIQVIDCTNQPRAAIETESYAVPVQDTVTELREPETEVRAVVPEEEPLDPKLLEQVQTYYEQGLQYFEKGEWTQALTFLEDVQRLAPGYRDVHDKLYRARKEEALSTLYARGEAHLETQRWEEAVEAFEKVATIDKDYPSVYLKLEEAKKQYELAQLYEKGMHCFYSKQWKEAIEFFEQLLEQNPVYKDAPSKLEEAQLQRQLDALYQEGMALLAKEQFAQAVEKFSQVCDINPYFKGTAAKLKEAQDKQTLIESYSKGTACYNEKNWLGAIEHFEKVMRIDPQYENAAKRLEDAKRHRGLELETETRLLELYTRGMRCLECNQWQEALDFFEQILSTKPDYKDVPIARLYAQGLKYLNDEDWPRAIRAFQQVIARDKQYERALDKLEEAKQGKEEELAELEKVADALYKEGDLHKEALYGLAMQQLGEDKWGEAIETLKRLLDIDPGYRDARDKLREAQLRQRWPSTIMKQIPVGVVTLVTAILCLTGVVGRVILFGPKATTTPTRVVVVPTAQTVPPSVSPTVIELTSTPSEPTATFTSEPTEEPSLTPEPTPPAASALSGKIAFPVYDPKRETYDIYLANADGSNRRMLVEEASQPAISPNGSKIAFRSWDISTLGLMVVNTDGTRPQRVSRGVEDASPCWASGESLVFHSTKEGSTPRLYVAGTWEGADGTNNVQDVKQGMEPVHGQYPAWVPDGRIVYKYFTQSGDFRGLYVMNSDGSNPTPITDHPGDTMPSVSPRGDKVAFMSDRIGRWEVYVVNIDGSGLRQLTNSGGYNSGLPTWSPGGRYIAFVSERGDQWAIWVVNADGSGERKLFDLDSPLPWWERISWAP